MNPILVKELAADTGAEDIPENYRRISELIGVENLVKLCVEWNGDMMYIPKADNILAAARNRHIKEEYNGGNLKELAAKYDLTPRQVINVIKNKPIIGQIDMFEAFPGCM